jgi:hypothetical protein
MDGKFRVKAEGGGRLQAPPVLRRNRRRIKKPPRFIVPSDVTIGPKLFFAWQIGCDYRQ